MSKNNLLVAVDPSGCAVDVVSQAAVLARDLNATVDLVTCVDLPSGVQADTRFTEGPMAGKTALEALREDAFTALSGLKLTFDQYDVAVNLDVKVGEPVEQVLEACDGHRMVILGTHGRKGLKRMLFGSIAEQILRQAAIPVMVIHADNAGSYPSPVQEMVEDLANG
ncbi:MAG: universal stress protein [Deltaproteobacteria bacterium]|nr:MAG: universal stress protein [Deltaproteobacteria bacterium]